MIDVISIIMEHIAVIDAYLSLAVTEMFFLHQQRRYFRYRTECRKNKSRLHERLVYAFRGKPDRHIKELIIKRDRLRRKNERLRGIR